MIVVASIVDGPVTLAAERSAVRSVSHRLELARNDGESGATFRFEGIVRRLESGRELESLEYEAYEPMAGRELEMLAAGVAESLGLTSIVAMHSRGRVGVGQVSFVLVVSSPHRAESLAAVSEFIDRLKRDIPIWKRPIWRNPI